MHGTGGFPTGCCRERAGSVMLEQDVDVTLKVIVVGNGQVHRRRRFHVAWTSAMQSTP